MSPDPRYLAIPAAVWGGVVLSSSALNWGPWVLSFTQLPRASMYSPATTLDRLPTTVSGSRRDATLTLRTTYPLSRLWKVIRSTTPVMDSPPVLMGWVEYTRSPPAAASRAAARPTRPVGILHPTRGPRPGGARSATRGRRRPRAARRRPRFALWAPPAPPADRTSDRGGQSDHPPGGPEQGRVGHQPEGREGRHQPDRCR